MLSLKTSKMLRRLVCAMMTVVLMLSLLLTASAAEGDGGLSVVASRPVDIALAMGASTVDFSKFAEDLADALAAVDGDYGRIDADDISITGIESTAVSTASSFEWLEFDHSNDGEIYGSADLPFVEDVEIANKVYGAPVQYANSFNALPRHIASTENGTKMTFYGYGRSAYSDFMLLEHHQRTKKEFTFAIKEYYAADALNGMGFFFNAALTHSSAYTDMASAYNAQELFLNGYLMYLQYNGSTGTNIYIYKVSGLNLYDFHNGPNVTLVAGDVFELIASTGSGVYASAHDLRKFRVVATPSAINVYYKGFKYGKTKPTGVTADPGDVFDTTDSQYQVFDEQDYDTLPAISFILTAGGSASTVPLDSDHGGASFGPMTQYNNHYCNKLTKVEFSELSMKMDVVRSLAEVVRQPQWREDTDRFVVYVNDYAIEDFASETATGELLNRLYEDNIYYVGWATDLNVDQSEAFLDAAPGGKILNRSNTRYETCIEDTARAIYDRYWKLNSQSTFVAGEGINIGAELDSGYQLSDTVDAEAWPKGRWYLVYDDNDFCGMGSYEHPQSGTFISAVNDFDFTQPGRYDIYYECDPDNLGEAVQTLIVHRLPVAAFSDVSGSGGEIALAALAYDPDVIEAFGGEAQDNGIATYAWRVVDAAAPAGSSPLLVADTPAASFTAATGVSYQVSLTVADGNGGTATATRLVGLAAEKEPIPYASFAIDRTTCYSNVPGYDTVYITDKSYLLYGDAVDLRYAYTLRDGLGDVVDTLSGRQESLESPATAGKYTLELTVHCGDVASEKASRGFTVITEPTPVLTAQGAFPLADGDYIYAGTTVSLGQTAQGIISGVTLQYKADSGAWTAMTGDSLTVPAGSGDFSGATYTFRAVSGATRNAESNTITLHVAPQDNPLGITWGFIGDSFATGDTFSPDNWYGSLTVSAQGTAGYARVTSSAVSASDGSKTASDSSKSGPASVSLAPDAIARYEISGGMVSSLRTSANGYAGATDAVALQIDPTIDTFIAKAKAALRDGSAPALKEVMDYYSNTLRGANRDHIGKNPVAKELLGLLNKAVADSQAALAQELESLLTGDDTRENYVEIQGYYDLLTSDTQAGLSETGQAALAKKLAALAAADAVCQSLAATDSGNAGYSALAYAVASYNALSPEALGLLTAEEKAQAGELVTLKSAVDRLDRAVTALQEDAPSPDSLAAIDAAQAMLAGLEDDGQGHFLPAGLSGQVKALADTAAAARAVQAGIDTLDSTSGLDDLRGPYAGYLALSDAAKAMVDTRVDGSDLAALYQAVCGSAANPTLEQLMADLLTAAGSTGKTADQVKALLARYEALPDGQKTLPPDVADALARLGEDYDKTRTVIIGVLGDRPLYQGSTYDALSDMQKDLVDSSTDGLGLVVSQAAKVTAAVKGLPAENSDDHSTAVEAAMEAYVRLSDRGKALLDSGLVGALERAHAAVLASSSLQYVNTWTDPATPSVTVIGMVGRVGLPDSAGPEHGFSTTVILQVADSVPQMPPQVEDTKAQVLSVDVSLWATVVNEKGEPVEEGRVQPKPGEHLTVLIELPARYAGQALEVYHVKDNGIILPINDYSISQIDGVHYLLIELDSFSHIMVYSERIVPPREPIVVVDSKPLPLAVTLVQASGGTVTPVDATIPYGGSRTFTVTPDAGYVIADVIVDGRSLGPVGTFTLEKVTAPVTIRVVFALAEGLPYYLEGEAQRFIGYATPQSGQLRWIARPDSQVLFAHNPQTFDDIEGHYAEASIRFVAERQLMQGREGLFAPGGGISRAELVAILGQLHERSFGIQLEEAEHRFADVDYTQPYGRYITWAEQNSIVLGVSQSAYAPDREISRQELATILYRYARYAGLEAEGGQELVYADADAIAPWAGDAALFCQQSGLIIGRPGSAFAPQAAALRGDVAIVLSRLINLAVDQLA